MVQELSENGFVTPGVVEMSLCKRSVRDDALGMCLPLAQPWVHHPIISAQ